MKSIPERGVCALKFTEASFTITEIQKNLYSPKYE